MFRAAGTVSDVSDVQLRKAELRAQVLARRSALPADQRATAGKLIRDAVLAAPQVQMAGTIAAYYSVGTEPSTHGLVYALWKRGISALAALDDNVHCKLSGLAMPLHSMEADALRPWIGHCLEVFGTQRCMFASNFPVDAMHGTFDQLYSAFDAITADLDPDERDQLFAANAERVYRC